MRRRRSAATTQASATPAQPSANAAATPWASISDPSERRPAAHAGDGGGPVSCEGLCRCALRGESANEQQHSAVWVINPFTALLLVVALHLWLVLASPEWRFAGRVPFQVPALAVVALGVAPLAPLVAFYAHQWGVAHTALLLLAGGRVGLVEAVLWSVAFGCLAAALLIALAARSPGGEHGTDSDGPGG
jgi:hypothetical protein